jgi:hypothetical protein
MLARVAELEDAVDLKSIVRKGVWVRVPPRAPYVRYGTFVEVLRSPPGAGELRRFGARLYWPGTRALGACSLGVRGRRAVVLIL